MDIALVVFLICFVLIFIIRIPIALGMIVTSIFYMLVKGLDMGLVANQVLTNLFSKYILMAVPLFIFTAKIMNTGRVTDMVFKFASSLVGGLKGGMGHVNVDRKSVG